MNQDADHHRPVTESEMHGQDPSVSTREISASATRFQGPLPHPEILRRYNEVVPGLAETIVRMAEREQFHRNTIEERIIRGEVVARYIGQTSAFVLGFLGIGGGVYLMAIGVSGEGIAAMISSLAALAGVFVYSKRAERQKKMLEQQRERRDRRS